MPKRLREGEQRTTRLKIQYFIRLIKASLMPAFTMEIENGDPRLVEWMSSDIELPITQPFVPHLLHLEALHLREKL